MNLFVKLAVLALPCWQLTQTAGAAESVSGEWVIRLKDQNSITRLKQSGLNVVKTFSVHGKSMAVVKSSGESILSESALESHPEINNAEPNYIYKLIAPTEVGPSLPSSLVSAHSDETPLDSRFGELWGLLNTGANIPGSTSGVAGVDINALKAWKLTKGDRKIKIAVIDTGVDYGHEDIKDNMWVNEAEKNGEPGVDDDGNGYIDDVYGYDFANSDADPMDDHYHGTHCAGTIGATHNDKGVAGVMADVSLVAVKFLTGSGSGTLAGALMSIDYSTKVGVDLMSNSWGGGGFSQELKDAIQRASDAGILFVAAAGNSSRNNDQANTYPANYEVPNVISVAAHTGDDTLATFSNYGRQTVEVAAPGHKVLSTATNNTYKVLSGTSMATPHVSGALGLLLAQEGRMEFDAVKERLMATSVPSSAYRRTTIGGGRLDAYNLLTDTRPKRIKPDPSKWERVTLEEAFETEHPYQNNQTLSRTISVEGAKFIRVVVEKYGLEKRYDTLKVFDGQRTLIESLSGEGENYTTDYIVGNSVTLAFKSDFTVSKWGILIKEVEVIYE